VLLQSDTNLVYFTGCFRGSGERTTWALLPVNETDTVYWFSPAIDRDLITSWWCTENDYYFCYPHAEGGFPNRGQLARGKRVDLWEWMLGKLAARGLGRGTIALDRELGPSAQRTWSRMLPSARAIDLSDECLEMQVIKTPEEIALTQRAYRYFDHIHAFARDYSRAATGLPDWPGAVVVRHQPHDAGCEARRETSQRRRHGRDRQLRADGSGYSVSAPQPVLSREGRARKAALREL
jgi:Xaa-Pro aminopeptidase